ncbi:MAG TPA: TonB family protein [Allosphingosinicella sp.]|jgi:protein TonB|nr:TonB family protein [Allosphingosinicella sp.]
MSAELNATNDRLKAGLPTLAVHLLLLLALLRGLGAEIAAPPPEAITLIDVAPPPPAVAAIPAVRERSRRPEGAASPPNLESQRTDIVAPPPVLPPPPQQVVTAATAGTGADPAAGSAEMPGPGTGSGGVGNGTGSGGRGTGPGGGGDGDGGGTPPRRIRGEIRDRDYPRAAGAAGVGGRVSVIYTVEADGRATHCAITDSSGSPELDGTTCRLIEQRFRFRPSQDRSGRPIRSRIVQDHIWETHDEAPVHEPPVRRRRILW